MGKVIMSGIVPNLSKPISGILASDIAVGSTIYLNESGSPVEYLVVNQGIPSGSSLYDNSCNGTWLLRKDIHSMRQWSSAAVGYDASDIHKYLNSEFIRLYEGAVQQSIVEAKIPYYDYGGKHTGANGVASKLFLLDGYEVGYSNSLAGAEYLSDVAAKLDYFEYGSTSGGANRTLRRAYINGQEEAWWLRSNSMLGNSYAFHVYYGGTVSQTGVGNTYGVRPALILPSNALFDKNTLLLKGVV